MTQPTEQQLRDEWGPARYRRALRVLSRYLLLRPLYTTDAWAALWAKDKDAFNLLKARLEDETRQALAENNINEVLADREK